jgi:hypothetical protein
MEPLVTQDPVRLDVGHGGVEGAGAGLVELLVEPAPDHRFQHDGVRLVGEAVIPPLADAVGERGPHPRDIGVDDDLGLDLDGDRGDGFLGHGWTPSLDASFEGDELGRRCLGERAEPALLDLRDRHRVEVVDAVPPLAGEDHQAGVGQHVEVVHHAVPGHLGVLRDQLTGGLRPATQGVQQPAAGRIGQGPEHDLIVFVDPGTSRRHVSINSHVESAVNPG